MFYILTFLLGALIVYLWLKAQTTKELGQLKTDLSLAQNQLSIARENAAKSLADAKQAAAEKLENQQKTFEVRLSSEKEAMAKSLQAVKDNAQERIEQEREHAANLREELQKENENKLKLLQEEVRNMGEQMLTEHRQKLNTADKDRLDALLNPLKERLEAFSQTVTKSSKESAEAKTEIRTTFEESLKRLQEGQKHNIELMREDHLRAVEELKKQTERIGNDAASLTQALKGDSKMQGDWGEMILEHTLEDCGLKKGEQYFLQENVKDEDGNNYRPDAIIAFPNNERAVIDAKVSLTAYQAALKAESKDEQDKYLKEHIKSVRTHVDELAAKNYDVLVPGCIGYVLMFIPYESGYSAAVKTDASILQYAYRKHIIILSPSNLLMALQLTHTMWQNYRLNKNVEEILRQSNDLYDKFALFAETFINIGASIDQLKTRYDKARGQLNTGKGNVVRKLEGLKALGITPKKENPLEIENRQ